MKIFAVLIIDTEQQFFCVIAQLHSNMFTFVRVLSDSAMIRSYSLMAVDFSLMSPSRYVFSFFIFIIQFCISSTSFLSAIRSLMRSPLCSFSTLILARSSPRVESSSILNIITTELMSQVKGLQKNHHPKRWSASLLLWIMLLFPFLSVQSLALTIGASSPLKG